MWTLPTLFVKRWIHTHIKTKTDGWALYIWEDDFSHIALTVNLLPFFHGNTKLRDNKFALICISPKKWKLQNYRQQTLANQSREKGPKGKLRMGFFKSYNRQQGPWAMNAFVLLIYLMFYWKKRNPWMNDSDFVLVWIE